MFAEFLSGALRRTAWRPSKESIFPQQVCRAAQLNPPSSVARQCSKAPVLSLPSLPLSLLHHSPSQPLPRRSAPSFELQPRLPASRRLCLNLCAGVRSPLCERAHSAWALLHPCLSHCVVTLGIRRGGAPLVRGGGKGGKGEGEGGRGPSFLLDPKLTDSSSAIFL